MKFVFDPNKSQSNLEKHGIDFDEARQLWEDDNRMEAPVAYVDEARFLVVGYIYNKLWTAVITYRGDAVRIISVRRSRKEEEARYHAQDY